MHWTNLRAVTPPSDTVVSLAKAKAHLRIDDDADNAYINGLIAAATATIDGPNGIGLAMLTQTWRASFDGFQNGGLSLAMGPIQSIDSVTYTDASGVSQTLSEYALDYDLDQWPVVIRPTSSWPSAALKKGSVKVTFTAGFGDDPDDVPADLIHAILFLIGHWFENREAVSDRPLKEVPMAVESILSRHRVW